MAQARSHKLYAMTIFGYKKAGMDEKEYHDYISETHAGHLKALLANNDIVSYTMKTMGSRLPTENISDCDAIIQIVFKDIEDYLRVQKDPHFINVVSPDHKNFTDSTGTKFAMGWFEVHVADGKVVS